MKRNLWKYLIDWSQEKTLKADKHVVFPYVMFTTLCNPVGSL